MSIGLVLRHTYEETCEVCDKIAVWFSSTARKWNTFLLNWIREHVHNSQLKDITKNKSTYDREGKHEMKVIGFIG